jgi:hypothetical protein
MSERIVEAQQAPPPPYVVGAEQRTRWHICERLAIELARANGEGDGFAADVARQLFFSAVETGSPAELTEEQRKRLGAPYEPPA